MATYTSNINNGSNTDENGHFRFLSRVFQGNGYGVTVIPSTTPNMTVTITPGDYRIPYEDHAIFSWSDANTIITVPHPDATNNRVDRIVAYVDRGMTFPITPANNPGSLKFAIISGTPYPLPQPPSDSLISSTIGVNNPFVYVADIYTNPMTTSINNFNIVTTLMPISIPDMSITPPYTQIPGNGIPYGTGIPISSTNVSFTSGSVPANAVNNLKYPLDANGWTKVVIGAGLTKYYKRGRTTPISVNGGDWKSANITSGPIGVDMSQNNVITSGSVNADDNALRVALAPSFSGTNNIAVSYNNAYSGNVNTVINYSLCVDVYR